MLGVFLFSSPTEDLLLNNSSKLLVPLRYCFHNFSVFLYLFRSICWLSLHPAAYALWFSQCSILRNMLCGFVKVASCRICFLTLLLQAIVMGWSPTETEFGMVGVHIVAEVEVVEGAMVFLGKEEAMGVRICKKSHLDTMNLVDQKRHHDSGVVGSYFMELLLICFNWV